MVEYSTSIHIDAPPDVVFGHLVTTEGMLAWMGQYAELEPTPGGRFAVDINGSPVRGRYLEIDPPHRVVVSWGIAGNNDCPPGSSRVEFTLTMKEGGTQLDLVHAGLPEQQEPGHARGWTHFLPRLRAAATGTDPGPDPWATLCPPRTPGPARTD
ncbi:MAG TPA: SRPBCC domain-containing protein [Acidimicrobiales bacterium]|nr:SRPBCC domain-containing protein [Acidimicrobiales bacterium]